MSATHQSRPVGRTFGQTGTEQTGDLFDKGLGSQKSVVFLGELLDKLLVLVESTQRGRHIFGSRYAICPTFSSHRRTCIRARFASHDRCRLHPRECRWTCEGGECWAICHGKMSSEQDRWTGDSVLDGARETFVSLRVIVLETDLEFDRLHKVALFLVVGSSKKFLDGAPHA